MTTSCRSTRRSTTATRAARPSTPRATWSASTPRSSRRRAAASASASPSPATWPRPSSQQLKDNGKVARGWLGVQIQPVSQDIADSLGLKDAKGAIVDKAEKDSPAAAAGLKDGDVITSVNGEAVANSHDLARKIAALGPKKEAELTIVRNGSPQTVKVMLGLDVGRPSGQGGRTASSAARTPWRSRHGARARDRGRGRRQDRRRGGRRSTPKARPRRRASRPAT